MPLPPDLDDAVKTEISVLKEVVASLSQQRQRSSLRHVNEISRASELTSNLVAARRVEDKAMLASDEAVSHALRDKFRGDVKILDRLIEKPYFARLVVKEETENGQREFEYRIGIAANTECRIIDWRKAPISKLYYEYREGDEYSEEILGRERVGSIVLRNMVEIERGQLRRLVCSKGTAIMRGNEWSALGGAGPGTDRSYAALPSVLALITAEQFRTITEDAESAVLIQGVAGSGKTTVALHRLAWLLHEDNSPLMAEDCIVIAINPILKLYIERSIKQLGLDGIAVRTFDELAAYAAAKLCPQCLESNLEAGSPKIRRPMAECPASLNRAKRSLAVFQALEECISAAPGDGIEPEKIYLNALANFKRILELDETKLLTGQLLLESYNRTKANLAEGVLDYGDDALLVRLHQLLFGTTARYNGSEGFYKQIVVDEVQELSPAELASIIASVEDLQHLTLVGDVAQRMNDNSGFPGWEKLRTHWDTSGSLSHYVTLSVSHRSTAQIMNLATAVQRSASVPSARIGRPPRWFYSRHESRAITAVLNWISKVVELYPSSLTAVICRDKDEAKLAYSFLVPSFGPSVRLWEDQSATFEDGIAVATVAQAKGLEFRSVVIWNPTRKSYPDTVESRNALYVAITRAEENLCLVTWQQPSILLPNPRSPLVRGYELDTQDETVVSEKQ